MHKLAQRLLCILIKVYYSWNSWRKYYYVCVRLCASLIPWSLAATADPWRDEKRKPTWTLVNENNAITATTTVCEWKGQQLLPAAHVWTCFAVARRASMREGTALAAKNFYPSLLRRPSSLWLSVYRWPPRVCLMQLSEAEVILPAACLTDWLADCLAAWLTDCLNGYGCWMACLLQLACKISVIHSFACFLCRLCLLCRLLMNRSTCRDALAVADNGQQLNKGNELKKKS